MDNHMIGCGMAGPLTEGDHGPCALCGGPLKLCGHNAQPLKQDARCCDRCNASVLDKRMAIMQWIEVLMRATRTPHDALAAREFFLKQFLMASVVTEDEIEMFRALSGAEIVAWDESLARAAMRGAEAFIGQPWEDAPGNMMMFIGQDVLHVVTEEGDTPYIGGAWVRVRGPREGIDLGKFSTRVGTTIVNLETAHAAALIRFMKLEIVQREAAHLPRQAKRALARANKPVPTVTVVRLRRVYAETATGESDVEWKHRWLVRGHWRNQWYSKTREHKLIYIAPFIKGPEGKPFLPQRPVVKVVNR